MKIPLSPNTNIITSNNNNNNNNITTSASTHSSPKTSLSPPLIIPSNSIITNDSNISSPPTTTTTITSSSSFQIHTKIDLNLEKQKLKSTATATAAVTPVTVLPDDLKALKITKHNFNLQTNQRPPGWLEVKLRRVIKKEEEDYKNGMDEETIKNRRTLLENVVS